MDDCVLVEGTARNSATFRTHRIFQRFGFLAGRTIVSRARWKRSPSREEAVSRCRKSTDLVASYWRDRICQDALRRRTNVKAHSVVKKSCSGQIARCNFGEVRLFLSFDEKELAGTVR